MEFLKQFSGHLLGWTLIRSLSNIELGIRDIESVSPTPRQGPDVYAFKETPDTVGQQFLESNKIKEK